MRELAEHVDHLAAISAEPGPLTALAAELRADPGTSAALDRLGTALGLTPFERDLLVLAGLPEEHELLAAAVRQLHPRGESWLHPALAVRLLRLDAGGRRHLRDALEVGPLHRHGVITVDGLLPLPESSIRLAPGLWSVLRGHDRWPARPAPLELRPAACPAGVAEELARALGGPRRVVVVDGAGARDPYELAGFVVAAARAARVPVVTVDAGAVGADEEPLLSLHALARGACPVLVGKPAAAPLPRHPGPVVICVEDAGGLPLDDRPVVTVDLGPRRLGESVSMWEVLLPELNGGAHHLASVLRLDQVQAARAVEDARATAAGLGIDVTVDDVVAHARRRTGSRLPPSARLVRPAAAWEALVTTADNEMLLRSLVDRVRGKVQVLHEWGFGGRADPGVRALFAGPPGTGKTLSAHIIAATLGLDLLVVDLSALVSKWLGETEKNISAVFEAAEHAQAVLFFDEADAVFGRRTDGGDAQARWANIETAHLLAKVDAFEGLVVLATNLRGHLDDAFVRRLDIVVEFDEPGPDDRRRLWEAHLPDAAPVAPDVDVAGLAGIYEITGGLIRNAAVAAAFQAAAAGRSIDHDSLLDAVAREYQKAGRSFPGRARRPAPIAHVAPIAHGGT